MPMVELRGLSALEAWTRKVTAGYKDVSVHDLSTSWRDGLAFCALIHHFRPDLIDFDSLSKENILYNNSLAFQTAEKHLGVPSLLDAEDMFKHEEPDRLSVATYLSQFYECFEGSKSDRKHSITKSSPKPITTTSNTTDTIGANNSQPIAPKRDMKCHHCKTRVYVLERVVVDDKLYHKSCFEGLTIDAKPTQSEDNNNENEINFNSYDIKLEESCDQMSIDSSDKSIDNTIGVRSVDPIVSSVDNQSIVTKPIDKSMDRTMKPEIPVKNFHLIRKNAEKMPEISSEKSEQSVPEDNDKLSAKDSEELTDKYEKSVTDFDNTSVDEVFNKVFGKTVRISDQISEITSEEYNIREEEPEEVEEAEEVYEPEEQKPKTSENIYPDDKNPFDDEEEKEVEDKRPQKKTYPDDKNPFGDEESDDEEVNKRSVQIRLRTPSDALNPFGDDDDEEETKQEFETTPKPKPRQSLVVTSSPSSALSSPTSSVRSRKKRPAPTPPTPSAGSIPQVNSSSSLVLSGESSRRDSLASTLSSELGSSVPNSRTPTPLPRHRLQKSVEDLSDSADSQEKSKLKSDLQSNDSDSLTDLKPTKKRPAPPIPAVKRMVKGSLADIEAELNKIGDKLPVIEKRGKELEELLVNNVTESSGQPSGEENSQTNGEERAKREELMNEFISTARERCHLAKRQKELMYMKREHKLEEIQADIEYQMRCVISKQSAQKTDEDLKREDELLKRLVEIIEERNDIVENMIRDENKEVEEYKKLISKVIPKNEPTVSATKEEIKISKHKSIDKNLVKLKDKLKLKDIKEKKKLKKLKETEKKDEKNSAKSETSSQSSSDKTSADTQSKSKPNSSSSKHLTLKSTLKPLKKTFGLKSSDKKSEPKATTSETTADTKTSVSSDKPIDG